MNTALGYGLAGDAGKVIDATGIKGIVRIGHPGHFTLTRTDIGSRNVFARSEIFFADQFGREAPRDFLYLFVAVFLRIKTQAALGPAEWHVDDCALVSHERRQRHDLVLIHEFTVTNSAFDRLLMLAVLGAPALEYFVFVAAEPDGELKVVDVVAGFDLAEKSGMNFQVLRCTIELLRDDSVEIEVFFRCERCRHSVSLLRPCIEFPRTRPECR